MVDQTPHSPAVKFSELLDAFEFVSAGGQYECLAYICTKTGKIYWVSDLSDVDERPADLEESEHYIDVPDKRQLDLGRRLVLRFVAAHLPDQWEATQDMFRRKGAYGRFKALLERHDRLEQWYAFEAEATEEALREWCRDNDIVLSEDPRATP